MGGLGEWFYSAGLRMDILRVLKHVEKNMPAKLYLKPVIIYGEIYFALSR
jgi:hypothetical protein